MVKTLIIKILIVCMPFACSELLAYGQPKPFIYWENMTREQQAEVLKNPSLPQVVQDFQASKFEFNDLNKKSIKLRDTVSQLSRDVFIKAYYFHIYNLLCKQAYGAGAELLGNTCQDIILLDPEYVFNYFITSGKLMDKYAMLLGYELYFKDDGISDIKYSYDEFSTIINKKLYHNSKYKKIVDSFFRKIRAVMNDME